MASFNFKKCSHFNEFGAFVFFCLFAWNFLVKLLGTFYSLAKWEIHFEWIIEFTMFNTIFSLLRSVLAFFFISTHTRDLFGCWSFLWCCQTKWFRRLFFVFKNKASLSTVFVAKVRCENRKTFSLLFPLIHWLRNCDICCNCAVIAQCT